ncbi:SCO family protein [Pacificimonas sp. ICDLI1SI03]
MNSRQPILIAALLMLISACSSSSERQEAPLAGAPIGGEFSLVDGDGNEVSNQSLQGQWRLMYFGYTFCPDVCPVDAARMGRAYGELEEDEPELAERLTPIFVTVDPERDTPEVVKEFAAAFHPRMIGLTGSQQAIDDMVDTFRVYKAKGDVREDGFYLMDHSAQIYLFDAEGNPVNAYARDVSQADIAADIANWMQAGE